MEIINTKLKRLVFLSDKQYQDLCNDGIVTVDGVTIEFNRNDEYRTPDKTDEKIAAAKAEMKAYIDNHVQEMYQFIDDTKAATYDGEVTIA